MSWVILYISYVSGVMVVCGHITLMLMSVKE